MKKGADFRIRSVYNCLPAILYTLSVDRHSLWFGVRVVSRDMFGEFSAGAKENEAVAAAVV